jgi:cell wall-associated NlpC family hydrolase
LATTGLIFIGSMGAVGASAVGSQQEELAPDTESMAVVVGEADGEKIVAPKAQLRAPRVDVKTQAAPPKPEPRVVEAPKVVTPPPAPPAVVQTPPPAPATVAPAPAPAPAAGTKAAAIAAAALAQLGVYQDCTMLATNSLAAVGIQFHDWPAGYLSLGRVVTAAEAIPGDLIYYANGGMGVAHIAVYIGNGVAVHGGWNGNQTVTFSANVGSGPVFIRVA